MSFWEPCFHSLWICPSLCFSGHVICSLAALLFLLLTPLRTLTSCRPHVDLWPTSLALFFFFFIKSFSYFLQLVHCLYFYSWNPTFLLCDRYPSHRLLSAPTGRGEVTPALSVSHTVSVCVHQPGFIPLSLSLLFSFFPLCPFPLFPSLFFLTPLHDCMCTRLLLLISLCVCMEQLGGWAAVTLACWR